MSSLDDPATAEQRRLKRVASEEQLRQLEHEERSGGRSPHATGSAQRYPVTTLPPLSPRGSSSQPINALRQTGPPKQPIWSLQSLASSSRQSLPPASVSPSAPLHTPPTPQSGAIRSVPSPSRTQVNDYLVTQMSMPAGLNSGWQIDGHRFDVYILFVLVLQMGGSSEVSVKHRWHAVAAMLGFSQRPIGTARLSSTDVAGLFRDFFMRILGGLELLWDRTRTIDMAQRKQDRPTPSGQLISAQPSTSAEPFSVAPRWATAPSMPTPISARPATRSSPIPLPMRASQDPTHALPGRPLMSAPSSSLPPVLLQPTPLHPPNDSTPRRLSVQAEQTSSPMSPQRVQDQPPQPSPTATNRPSPRLTEYDPPVVPSFDHLVFANLLPLPSIPPGLKIIPSGTLAQQYDVRCHELRSAVRKMTAGEPFRALSREELVFWDKLLAVLKKNQNVRIPGVDDTASPKPHPRNINGEGLRLGGLSGALEPSRPATPPSAGSSVELPVLPALKPNGAIVTNLGAIVTNLGANGVTDGSDAGVEPTVVPKKRGRPPKLFDEHGSEIKRPVGRPRKPPKLDGSAEGKPQQGELKQEIEANCNGEVPGASGSAASGTGKSDANLHHNTSIINSFTEANGTAVRSTGQHQGSSSIRVVQSSTPAADFLKLIGARITGVTAPLAANTPAKPPSPSPRKMIHLSGARMSEARLRQQDLSTPLKPVTKKSRGSGASSTNSQSLVSSGRRDPSTPNTTIRSPARKLATRPRKENASKPSAVANNDAIREALPSMDHLDQTEDLAAPYMSKDVTDSALSFRPLAVLPRRDHAQEKPVDTAAAPVRPLAPTRSPSIVAVDADRNISKAKGKARARSPSITLISTPVRRMIPFVELPSSRKVRVIRKQRPVRPPVDRAKVVIAVSKRRRAVLIQKGYYDAFRDDDSDDDSVIIYRHGYLSLRALKPLPRNSVVRTARPRDPEAVPFRFFSRPGPALVEPFKSVLQEDSLLRRAVDSPCGWKGCDAVLASEEILSRHVRARRHALQGKFMAGAWGNQTLYRCHWKGCEEPCFKSIQELEQHMVARHISRVLFCPYQDCDLTSPTISHLSRHVMKQHDDPTDKPRPLANLVQRLPPPLPIPSQEIPEVAHTVDLTTHVVTGTLARSVFRQLHVRNKVQANCFAGDDPVMHVDHAPHILEPLEQDASAPASTAGSVEPGGEWEKEERLLDKVLGRKRRLEVVVELPLRRFKVM